jgi:predicted AAA+ superfamily ATPase
MPDNSNCQALGSDVYERFVERRADEALSDTPVVLIVGPRRAGKTTLVRKMGEAGRTYITLDDQTVLDAARSDPAGFIRGLDRAIIDEIQRAPDLLLAIKKTVDEDNRPGRFLLTGSANVLTLPRVADSLAGRMETIRMLPLARAEIAGKVPTFLERLFSGKLQGNRQAIVGDELVRLTLLGGFAEAISRENERRRQGWARSYLTSVLTRDLRDIAEIEKLTELPKFVRLLAEHSGQLVNYSRLGSSIDVSHKTGQRYVGLLEQVFLVSILQPWYTNALKRIARTPKLHFLDSGLLATARGLSFDRVKADRDLFGALLESFVFFEVSEARDGVGPATDTLPFPRPADARGGHRAGTRRRRDRRDRGQGVRDGEVQRLRRAADLGRGVRETVCLRRRALR